jgi:Enoyl-CoA hydratase/carnithine racemase
MADVVSIERVGPIGLIALDNPPVNAAGHGLRAGLVEAVETLEAEDGIAVIGLYGAGRTFIAGADIREFGKPPRDPWLPEVCNRLESCAKPIVSVLHGAALGGGFGGWRWPPMRGSRWAGRVRLGLPRGDAGHPAGARAARSARRGWVGGESGARAGDDRQTYRR